MGMYVLLCILVVSGVHGASTAADVEERKAQALSKIPTKIQELTDVVVEQCSTGLDTVSGLAQIVNATHEETSKYIKNVVEALEKSVTHAVKGLSDVIEQNSNHTKVQMDALTSAVLKTQDGMKQMTQAIQGLTMNLKKGYVNGGGNSINDVSKLPVVRCQNPFRNYNGQCLFISNSEQPWKEAQRRCKQIGGDLAENTDLEALINFVNLEGLVSTSYWIGASDHDSPRNFHWISGNQVSTGWRVDQVEPDYANPGRDCVYIRDKGIGDLVCSHAFGFLCSS